MPVHKHVYAPSIPTSARAPLAPEEPFPGVWATPLLSPEFCAAVWEELHNFEATAKAQPDLRLPLRIRHDGNVGDLQVLCCAVLLLLLLLLLLMWCSVVWCAEGAVTKRQWPGWSCTRENASREGCVSKCTLCVVCCAPVGNEQRGPRLPL